MAKQHAQSQRAQREVSGRGPCTQSRQQTVVEPFSRSKPQLQSRQKPFYKQHKQQERTYVEAKKALIAEVATILEDPNWRDYVGRMKSVQNDWKKTGRISRRLSNKLWEEFKGLTNLYFDRLKTK